MESPIITAKEWQSQILQTRTRLMTERKRVWPEGSKTKCPICTKPTMAGRSDFVREVDSDSVVLVFSNLHGAGCDACGTEFLEAYEQIAIEERAGTAFRTSVDGSITRLGGQKLGTYWPKDIAAALDMHARDRLRITALAPDTAVVRVVHNHD